MNNTMDAVSKNEDIYIVKLIRTWVFIDLTFGGKKSSYQAFLAEVSWWGLQSS